MFKFKSLLPILVLLMSPVVGASDADLIDLTKAYANEAAALKIPPLELYYADNFSKIQDALGIQKQKMMLERFTRTLNQLDQNSLSPEAKISFEAFQFQLALETQRVSLEAQFRKSPQPVISSNGLFHQKNGKQWYEYYVRRWTSCELEPSAWMQFGKKEVARIRAEMKRLQKEMGFEGQDQKFFSYLNGPQFIISDEAALQTELERVQDEVLSHLSQDFIKSDVVAVKMKKAPDGTKDSPPGYYDQGTFYYNFWNARFPKRSLEWLFLHEGIPGHHYQGSVVENPITLFADFGYSGFSEGWAAYVEDIGSEVGALSDLTMQYGKWEWDLVRSLRVILDIGINYYGWSPSVALQVWKKNIPNQDAIAEREINRMIQAPAQVLAYKIGEREFLEGWKRFQASTKLSRAHFHERVLKQGPLPLSLLRTLIP